MIQNLRAKIEAKLYTNFVHNVFGKKCIACYTQTNLRANFRKEILGMDKNAHLIKSRHLSKVVNTRYHVVTKTYRERESP